MKIKRLLNLGSAFVLSLSTLLTLGMPLSHAAGGSFIWTGTAGDNQIGTAGNWDVNSAPGAGDFLVFPQGVTATINNNLSVSFGSFGIGVGGSGTSDYTFTGNAIATYGMAINGTTDATFNGPVTFDSTVSGSNYPFGLRQFSNSATFNATVSADTTLPITGPSLQTTFNGNITGTGSTKSLHIIGANVDLLGDDSTLSNVTIDTSSSVYSDTEAGLGSGSVYVTDSDLILNQTATFSQAFNVSTSNIIALSDTASRDTHSVVTISGGFTNGNGTIYKGTYTDLHLTGVVNGPKITLLDGYTGNVIVDASTNNSTNMPNGTYKPGNLVTTINSGDNTTDAIDVEVNNTLVVNGQRGDITVYSGGTLKGGGSVGILDVRSGGTVAPGQSPGCLTAGNTTLAGTLQAEIGGTTVCTQYDQLIVNGTVNVTNGTLTPKLANGFVPSVGQSFTVINNDSNDAITGTFTGIAQDGTVTGDGVTYTVSYMGGDGNDVVLTVKSIDASALPKSPNTGFKLLTSNPLAAFAITTLIALSLVVISKRMNASRAK